MCSVFVHVNAYTHMVYVRRIYMLFGYVSRKISAIKEVKQSYYIYFLSPVLSRNGKTARTWSCHLAERPLGQWYSTWGTRRHLGGT
jgi:hypothetical protein